jgi:Spy/CpxP family protein refolding chaperone
MTTTTKKSIGLTVLALSLAMSMPALAQTTTTSAPPPFAPMMGGSQNGGFGNGGSMHQEFREEIEKNRAERQALDKELNTLLDKCIPTPKGQDDSCKKEKEGWRAHEQKLREEIKTMYDKRQTIRKERIEMRGQGVDSSGRNMPPAAPAAPAK